MHVFLFGRTLVCTVLTENLHFDYLKEWLAYIRVTWLSGFFHCFQVAKLWIVFRIFWPFAPALLVTSLYTVLLNVTKNSNKPFRINQRGYFRMNILSQNILSQNILSQVNWIDSKSEIIHIKWKYSHFPLTPGFSKVHRFNQFRVDNSDYLSLFLYLECLELFPCS